MKLSNVVGRPTSHAELWRNSMPRIGYSLGLSIRAAIRGCFECHWDFSDLDSVFTRYAP